MITPIKHIKNFMRFAAKELGLSSLPKINLVGSQENKKNAFGHFIGDRKGTIITVRITDRHPIDIMRTIAHELIHYKQRLSNVRSSETMKEDEANALAGRIMRKFDTTYPEVFKDKPLREDVGVAAVGGAVNNVGDGQIAKFDPILATTKKKKLRDVIFKRKTLEELNNIFHKKTLFADGGHKRKPMKDKFSIKKKTNFNHLMKDEDSEEKHDYKMSKIKGKVRIRVGE